MSKNKIFEAGLMASQKASSTRVARKIVKKATDDNVAATLFLALAIGEDSYYLTSFPTGDKGKQTVSFKNVVHTFFLASN